MATDRATLFVLEEDDLQRMAKRSVFFVQHLRDFNRRNGADIAVVIAAHWHGINVGTDQQRLQRRLTARACANDVPGGIDVDIEPGFFHQCDGIIAALKGALLGSSSGTFYFRSPTTRYLSV